MAGALSKRQQARNEKALQELVQTVPGNNLCADCSARNPAWASWSLGVFLCVRCATIHRKLGTHISKVKSLSMDSWSNEQVENMRKVGNATSNKIYNPQNKKPSIPIDADEVDSAMERFIRAKYIQKNINGLGKKYDAPRISEEGPPPPLPPKTGKFGLRSASSIFPLSSRAKKAAAMRDAMANGRESPRSPSPRLTNKQSKVFGASVDYNTDEMDKKLARLRDMGFMDNSRNAVVLKGVNGNLERAIEALVRLGEGDRKSPAALVSPRESSLRASRSLTPITPTMNGHQNRPTTPSTASSNPFDMLPPQPQTAQSTGTLQNKNPYFPSTNPFGAPTQDPITQAFQNMSLSPAPSPAPPLFPNHTGGVPNQPNQPVYYQSSAPATAPIPFNSNQIYPQPQMQQHLAVQQPQAPQQTVQVTGYNPFFSNQAQAHAQQPPQQMYQMPQQQVQQQHNLTVNTSSLGGYGSNPFTRSPTRMQSPPLGQIPEQAQYVMGQPAQQNTNPFLAQSQSPIQAPMQTQTPFQPMPTGQPMMHQQQQPLRPDKASILALYNYPHLAPQQAQAQEQQQQQQQQQQQPPVPVATESFQHAANAQEPRSIPSPAPPGSKNPFFNSGGPTSPSSAPAVGSTNMFSTSYGQHGSRESVQLGMDMASWANGGRHSPDAFASLSARHV